jgi:hypothetical protein
VSAMPEPTDHFSLLELDSPTSLRAPDAPEAIEPLELDLTTPGETRCNTCKHARPINEQGICLECYQADVEPAEIEEFLFGATEEVPPQVFSDNPAPASDLIGALSSVSTESSTNAANVAANNLGSMAGGQMRGVGFSTRDGYITALRNGVPAHTYQSYLQTLRAQYGMTTADINALQLPPPMAQSDRPVGAGVVHNHGDGQALMDAVKASRDRAKGIIVGPKTEEERAAAPRLSMKAEEMIAGFDETASHVCVAWSGTSDMTRGALLAVLEQIDRTQWAPKAPEAKAQAGKAIAGLGRNGLHVKSQRKSGIKTNLKSGEHIWTCGTVDHTGSVGDKYGTTTIRFKLTGNELSFEADQADSLHTSLAHSVVTAFNARMASEIMPTGRITGWIRSVLRTEMDAVGFGAMGYVVPKKYAADAVRFCEAVAEVFGSDWVIGMPMTDCEQLRDGLARGLRGEVDEMLHRLKGERERAADERVKALAENIRKEQAGEETTPVRAKGDIGEDRAQTHLNELRSIGARVVAWGEVLGNQLFVSCKQNVRRAILELEGLLGEDYTGIGARFEQIWDEIELDRKRAGGVL